MKTFDLCKQSQCKNQEFVSFAIEEVVPQVSSFLAYQTLRFCPSLHKGLARKTVIVYTKTKVGKNT